MKHPVPRLLLRPLALVLFSSLASTASVHGQGLTRDSVATTGQTDRVIVVGQAPEAELPAVQATTATRLPARILDTDRSVEVINRQTFEDRQINDPQEAIQNVSGVERASAFTGIGENYIVRGFQQQDLLKDGFRAGGIVGASLFAASGPTDVANLDRIEVLKGPSAILYGRGEPGGVVNYVTRQAVFEDTFSLKQEVGSYDFYRTEIDANWQPVKNKFALRLDAAYDRGDSFIDFVDGERYFAAPALLWQIDQNTSLSFRGEYSHDFRSSNPGLPYVDGRVYPGIAYSRYYGEPGVTDFTSEEYRGLLQLEHRWSEGILTTLSVHARDGTQDGNYFILFNFAGGPLVDPVTGDIARAVATVDFDNINVTARLDQLFEWTLYQGAEPASASRDGKDSKDSKTAALPALRRGGFPTVKNQLLFSAEYDHEENRATRLLSSQASINAFDPHYTGFAPLPLVPFPNFPLRITEITPADTDAYSGLLLDRLSFGQTVYLSLGGRLEYFEGKRSTTYPTPNVPFANNSTTQYLVTFNPTAGLIVKPSRNTSLYFNYAESTNSFKNFNNNTANGQPLDPERSRQYELGAKAEFFHQKLLATAAIFQIEKNNVAGTDPNNPLFAINSGTQRSRGFEFDLNGEVLPGWRFIVDYAYVDAKITDAPLGLDVNHRLYGAPENSGSFFTTYEFQNGPLKGFGLGGGVTFSDRAQADNENSGDISGWAQTDLVAFYRRGPFRAQVNVKNLFDNEFYYAQNQSAVTQAPARTIIGSVAVKF